MSNYQRLISYIYAYEGGIKGKNMGFAKIETRGIQCKITVSVKKVYVGGNDIGVYLLAGEDEICLGNIFIRGGSGEFRTMVSTGDVEHAGVSLEQCYGLTLHDVKNTWRSYTTIWEDSVAHAAELDLAGTVLSREEGTALISEAAIKKAVKEIEKEFPLPGAPGLEPGGIACKERVWTIEEEIESKEDARAEAEAAEAEAAETERKEEVGTEAEQAGEERKEDGRIEAEQEGRKSVGGETERKAGAWEEAEQREAEYKANPWEKTKQREAEYKANPWEETKQREAEYKANPWEEAEPAETEIEEDVWTEARQPEAAKEALGQPQTFSSPMQENTICYRADAVLQEEKAASPKAIPETTAPQVAFTEMPPSQSPSQRANDNKPALELGDPNELERFIKQEEDEENSHDRIWEELKGTHAKILAFDYEKGCEILTIKPRDIGLLPREEWVYGNNSFLLHGFYNYRYLILARLNNPEGTPSYLLGVPGHYYSNERYMASMFGFPNFVLSKEQPVGDNRFGYWYTDVKLGS